MRVLLAALIAGLCETIRESLPSDDHEAGMFVSGMTYAFVIFVALLILTTIVYAKAAGVRL